MTAQVCSGAMLLCSCGLSPSALVTSARPVRHTAGPALATVEDCLPMANIPPFSGCTAPGNPSPLPIKPCTPQPAGSWSIEVPGLTVMGVPALAQNAVLSCSYGGVISISVPGPPGLKITSGEI